MQIKQVGLRALFFAVFWLGTQAAAWAGALGADAEPRRELASAAALVNLPPIDAAALEPVVAAQIEQARTTLQALQGQSADRGQLSAAYGELGKLYQVYGLVELAEICYRNALVLEPDAYDWNYYLAYLYEQSGRIEEALHYYRIAADLHPEPALAETRIGDLHYLRGSHDEAKAAYLRALFLQPGASALLARLGELALEEQRFELAIKYLSNVLAANPEANRLYYSLGMAQRGLGREQVARESLALSGPVGVKPPDALVDELQTLVRGERLYVLQGKLAYSMGDYERAEQDFRAALESNPNSARARINLGSTLAVLGRSAEAAEQYRQALSQEPENLTAHYNLGHILVNAGQGAEAAKHLEPVLAANPEDAEAQELMAQAREQQGDVDAALEHYKLAVRLNQRAEGSWMGGAQLLVSLQRYEEAINVLEQAHRALPESLRIAHALAKMRAGVPEPPLRDGKQALALAEHTAAANPSPLYLQTLAMAHAEVGQCEEAAAAQQRALEQARDLGLTDAERLQPLVLYYREKRPCRYPGD
jgi:tetratricopeptide (TPR) repeat protein